MIDVYPVGGDIYIIVYAESADGFCPAILERLLSVARNPRGYLTSIAKEFPGSMRMLQKLSALVHESNNDMPSVSGPVQNQYRPSEWEICFVVE